MDKVRFLIIRFSSIGDIVLTTPVIRNLKKQVEGAEVHFLTKSKFSEIVEHNPYIDKVHTLNNNFPELLEELKNTDFDYVIDLHKNLRSLRVKQTLHRISFSFQKLNFKKWIYVQFKINRLPDVHIVDRYMKTLELFDVKNDEQGLNYFFNPEYNENYTLPETHKNGYIIAVMGANHFTKQIPNDMYSNLLNKTGKPVVLIGGTKEKKIANELVKKLQTPVANFCGKLSLDESASLIKNCNVVLTPDTGMMHIAAALKKPIVSVWGNTTPSLGMYPYLPGNKELFYVAEVKGLKCRPCSKIGYEKCPKKHFKCMLQQDISKIVSQLNNYWNRNE